MANSGDDRRAGFLWGCLGIMGILLVTAVVLLSIFIQRQRQAAQYPGSIPLSSHSNYRQLPSHFRWDNTYRTLDPFPNVYNWYSVRFDLGTEKRANGKCILLEGADAALIARRYMSVLLCNTPTGQMIFVSRSTSLK